MKCVLKQRGAFVDGGIKGAKVKWEICPRYLSYSILKDLHKIARNKLAFLPAQGQDDPKDLARKYKRNLTATSSTEGAS